MQIRLMGVALALTMLLSGCGHSDFHYGSAQEIARAVGCKATSSPEANPNHGYTLVTCTFQGDPLAIYWMQGTHMEYFGMPWVKADLQGDHYRWNVACASHAQCVQVQNIIGGDIPRRVNSHPVQG